MTGQNLMNVIFMEHKIGDNFKQKIRISKKRQ